MATDTVIRSQLLKQLGNISPQALSQRAQTIKKRFGPMSTEDAVYVLAHEQGIDISKRLDPETVERINRHVSGGRQSPPNNVVPTGRASRKEAVITIAGISADRLPGMSMSHAQDAERMAKRVFPLLYVFENSLRDVINSVMTAQEGSDWFKKHAPKKLKVKVEGRKRQEGDDAWHSKRGLHEVHYLDLRDLAAIVRNQQFWPHFRDLLPRENWLDGIIDDMNVSRRVAAHMNPLNSDDIKQIEAGFTRWAKQIRAKAALLP